MGRKNYKAGRKDAEILLRALLSFVEELAESTACADLEKIAKASWQGETELWVTQTTLKGLAELTGRYGHSLDTEQIRNAIACLFALKILEDKREQISHKTKTNSDVWRFALNLPSIDTEENLKWLFEPEGEWYKRRQAQKSKPGQVQKPTAPKSQGVDWSKICRTMLEKQKRLTTNELLSADEDMKFELKDIHVPLALVQRTKPDKRSGDEGNSPEQGSRLYEPTYEEKQRFKHEDFLAQVLQEGKGQSKGKRIALIGEPGAGKTTLLQSIAFWISKNNLGLPIWISLADLQQADGNLKEFNEYLLCDWLNKAIPKPRLTSAIETDFTNQFESRQVWLLLDGVDEVVEKCGSILNKLKQQLQGWVAKARVVLTCRLNIWETNANALEDFETYRLLDFDYPEQVREFICRWFRKSDPDKGEQLSTELDKSERQRIQDLVKNPLRLALLCSTWHRWQEQGGLPDTKAKLYKGFVDYFYDWKHNKHPTSKHQRQTLNKALGELSKWAIDQPTSRFRLRLDQIPETLAETLGDKDEEGSLLWLATTKLGWLNNVGFAVENPNEVVYAFFHPTFQEYFAALAIADWDFFLPRTHDNRNPKPVSERYRIFEPQWKEVILLWLGRPHEEVAKEQKEEFIKALVEFKDGFQDLYWYQAYFLAAAGIAELANCNLANEIVKQIVQWAFGYFDTTKQAWQSFPPLDQKAIAMLRETLRSQVITELQHVKSLLKLDKIVTGNPNGISPILNIIKQSLDIIKQSRHSSKETARLDTALDCMHKIGVGSPEAISILFEVVYSDLDYGNYAIRENAASALIAIGAGNPDVFKFLISLVHNGHYQEQRIGALRGLEKIIHGDLFRLAVVNLRIYLQNLVLEKNRGLYVNCYRVLGHCAQNMTYPAFYQAWHQQEGLGKTTTSDRQTLNQADLPQSLHSAIANDPQLSQTIHLICIDGSQFIERDRPAAEIYDQMLDQNCPECDSVPETMPALKLYWNSLKRNSDKRVILVFYASSSNPYSEAFLTALSKFGRAICVVTSPPAPLLRGEGSKSNSGSPSSPWGEGVRGWGSLQFFAPSQAIANLLEWIRAN